MQWMIEKTKVGGGSRSSPEEIGHLSEEAKEFIRKSFEDIIPELGVWDHHCHIAGFGHQDTGCFMNKTMMTQKKAGNPVHKIKYFVFVSAALDHEETATRGKRKENRFAAEDLKDFDGKYLRRLARLVRGIPGPWGKQFLLAMDCWHDLDGTRRADKTGLYIPNDYVLRLCAENPDIFAPAASIHPYRADGVTELERCYKAGVRMIKWLPNSMGIDPSHEKCIPFYDKMAELGMVLLSHTGKEHTVDGGELRQEYGNPLMLRNPMDRGVQVIAAHCSSRGDATDLDDPDKKKVPALSLFFRLMDDPRYENLFFGDISALTSFKRVRHALPQILNRTDIHHRLLNGSDYPLPAINVIVWSRKLKKKRLLSKTERRILKEIYSYNPLLSDYLVKRTVTSREGNKFSASVFMRNPLLKIYDDLPAETVRKYSTLKRASHERRKSDGDNNRATRRLARKKLAASHRRHSSAGESDTAFEEFYIPVGNFEREKEKDREKRRESETETEKGTEKEKEKEKEKEREREREEEEQEETAIDTDTDTEGHKAASNGENNGHKHHLHFPHIPLPHSLAFPHSVIHHHLHHSTHHQYLPPPPQQHHQDLSPPHQHHHHHHKHHRKNHTGKNQAKLSREPSVQTYE